MKKLILIFSLFALVNMAYSQDTKVFGDKTHEINLGVLSPFAYHDQVIYPYYLDAYYGPYYYNDNSYIPVYLKYKFHFWNFAARASFGVRYQQEENTQTPTYSYENAALSTSVKVGLQYQHQLKRVQIFYGIDLYQTQYVSTNESSSQYDNGSGIQYYSSKYEYTRTEKGISPFLGIQYYLNEHFSLGVESSYMIGKYMNKTQYNLDLPSKSHGTRMQQDQVALISVNVHF
ncbi:MAG: hypothetical protein K9I34_06160 [Bacteroidales bacterium]|nr:hypothetical protein [Bacteroidales bacterium]